MRRFFVIVTPNCPNRQSIKVGSKECTQCDDFRGGIVENFVDCAHEANIIPPDNEKTEIKRGRPAKMAISKPIKKRKQKK